MSQIPRLFVPGPLGPGQDIQLEKPQAHYLVNVLRLGPAAMVLLFDGMTGEWQAHLAEAGRRHAVLKVDRRVKPVEDVPDLWLCVAPLKRQRFEWVIEKATELGVATILPVLTRRTVADRVNNARLHAHMVEAAEQCERTRLPVLEEPLPLHRLCERLAGRTLIFADEEGGEDMARLAPPLPAAILIGPEGGFDASERQMLLDLPGTLRLSLGPRILRADTAAVAAIAQFQLVSGDGCQIAGQ